MVKVNKKKKKKKKKKKGHFAETNQLKMGDPLNG